MADLYDPLGSRIINPVFDGQDNRFQLNMPDQSVGSEDQAPFFRRFKSVSYADPDSYSGPSFVRSADLMTLDTDPFGTRTDRWSSSLGGVLQPGQAAGLSVFGRAMSREQLLSSDSGRKLLELEERIRSGRKRGFWDALTDFEWSDIPFLSLFASVGGSISDAVMVSDTMKKLQNGEPVTDEELIKTRLYMAEQEYRSDAGIGSMIGDIVRAAPGFMVEFFASSGMYSLARAGITKAAGSSVKALSHLGLSRITKMMTADAMGKIAGKEAVKKLVKETGEEALESAALTAGKTAAKDASKRSVDDVWKFLAKHNGSATETAESKYIKKKLINDTAEKMRSAVASDLGIDETSELALNIARKRAAIEFDRNIALHSSDAAIGRWWTGALHNISDKASRALLDFGKYGTELSTVEKGGFKTAGKSLSDALGVFFVEAPLRGALISAPQMLAVKPLVGLAFGQDGRTVSAAELSLQSAALQTGDTRLMANASAIAFGINFLEYASESSGRGFTSLLHAVSAGRTSLKAAGAIAFASGDGLISKEKALEAGSWFRRMIHMAVGTGEDMGKGLDKQRAISVRRAFRSAAERTDDPVKARALEALTEKTNSSFHNFMTAAAAGDQKAALDALGDGAARKLVEEAGGVDKFIRDSVKEAIKERELGLTFKRFSQYIVADKMFRHGWTPDATVDWLTHAGYDGLIQEMLEERYSDFAKGLFGWDERTSDEKGFFSNLGQAFKNLWPGWDQLVAEAVGFSVPMGVRMAVNHIQKSAGGSRLQQLKHYADMIEEIDAAPGSYVQMEEDEYFRIFDEKISSLESEISEINSRTRLEDSGKEFDESVPDPVRNRVSSVTSAREGESQEDRASRIKESVDTLQRRLSAAREQYGRMKESIGGAAEGFSKKVRFFEAQNFDVEAGTTEQRTEATVTPEQSARAIAAGNYLIDGLAEAGTTLADLMEVAPGESIPLHKKIIAWVTGLAGAFVTGDLSLARYNPAEWAAVDHGLPLDLVRQATRLRLTFDQDAMLRLTERYAREGSSDEVKNAARAREDARKADSDKETELRNAYTDAVKSGDQNRIQSAKQLYINHREATEVRESARRKEEEDLAKRFGVTKDKIREESEEGYSRAAANLMRSFLQDRGFKTFQQSEMRAIAAHHIADEMGFKPGETVGALGKAYATYEEFCSDPDVAEKIDERRHLIARATMVILDNPEFSVAGADVKKGNASVTLLNIPANSPLTSEALISAALEQSGFADSAITYEISEGEGGLDSELSKGAVPLSLAQTAASALSPLRLGDDLTDEQNAAIERLAGMWRYRLGGDITPKTIRDRAVAIASTAKKITELVASDNEMWFSRPSTKKSPLSRESTPPLETVRARRAGKNSYTWTVYEDGKVTRNRGTAEELRSDMIARGFSPVTPKVAFSRFRRFGARNAAALVDKLGLIVPYLNAQGANLASELLDPRFRRKVVRNADGAVSETVFACTTVEEADLQRSKEIRLANLYRARVMPGKSRVSDAVAREAYRTSSADTDVELNRRVEEGRKMYELVYGNEETGVVGYLTALHKVLSERRYAVPDPVRVDLSNPYSSSECPYIANFSAVTPHTSLTTYVNLDFSNRHISYDSAIASLVVDRAIRAHLPELRSSNDDNKPGAFFSIIRDFTKRARKIALKLAETSYEDGNREAGDAMMDYYNSLFRGTTGDVVPLFTTFKQLVVDVVLGQAARDKAAGRTSGSRMSPTLRLANAMRHTGEFFSMFPVVDVMLGGDGFGKMSNNGVGGKRKDGIPGRYIPPKEGEPLTGIARVLDILTDGRAFGSSMREVLPEKIEMRDGSFVKTDIATFVLKVANDYNKRLNGSNAKAPAGAPSGETSIGGWINSVCEAGGIETLEEFRAFMSAVAKEAGLGPEYFDDISNWHSDVEQVRLSRIAQQKDTYEEMARLRKAIEDKDAQIKVLSQKIIKATAKGGDTSADEQKRAEAEAQAEELRNKLNALGKTAGAEAPQEGTIPDPDADPDATAAAEEAEAASESAQAKDTVSESELIRRKQGADVPKKTEQVTDASGVPLNEGDALQIAPVGAAPAVTITPEGTPSYIDSAVPDMMMSDTDDPNAAVNTAVRSLLGVVLTDMGLATDVISNLRQSRPADARAIVRRETLRLFSAASDVDQENLIDKAMDVLGKLDITSVDDSELSSNFDEYFGIISSEALIGEDAIYGALDAMQQEIDKMSNEGRDTSEGEHFNDVAISAFKALKPLTIALAAANSTAGNNFQAQLSQLRTDLDSLIRQLETPDYADDLTPDVYSKVMEQLGAARMARQLLNSRASEFGDTLAERMAFHRSEVDRVCHDRSELIRLATLFSQPVAGSTLDRPLNARLSVLFSYLTMLKPGTAVGILTTAASCSQAGTGQVRDYYDVSRDSSSSDGFDDDFFDDDDDGFTSDVASSGKRAGVYFSAVPNTRDKTPADVFASAFYQFADSNMTIADLTRRFSEFRNNLSPVMKAANHADWSATFDPENEHKLVNMPPIPGITSKKAPVNQLLLALEVFHHNAAVFARHFDKFLGTDNPFSQMLRSETLYTEMRLRIESGDFRQCQTMKTMFASFSRDNVKGMIPSVIRALYSVPEAMRRDLGDDAPVTKADLRNYFRAMTRDGSLNDGSIGNAPSTPLNTQEWATLMNIYSASLPKTMVLSSLSSDGSRYSGVDRPSVAVALRGVMPIIERWMTVDSDSPESFRNIALRSLRLELQWEYLRRVQIKDKLEAFSSTNGREFFFNGIEGVKALGKKVAEMKARPGERNQGELETIEKYETWISEANKYVEDEIAKMGGEQRILDDALQTMCWPGRKHLPIIVRNVTADATPQQMIKACAWQFATHKFRDGDMSIANKSGLMYVPLYSGDHKSCNLIQIPLTSSLVDRSKVFTEAEDGDGKISYYTIASKINFASGVSLMGNDSKRSAISNADAEQVPMVGATVDWTRDETGRLVPASQPKFGEARIGVVVNTNPAFYNNRPKQNEDWKGMVYLAGSCADAIRSSSKNPSLRGGKLHYISNGRELNFEKAATTFVDRRMMVDGGGFAPGHIGYAISNHMLEYYTDDEFSRSSILLTDFDGYKVGLLKSKTMGVYDGSGKPQALIRYVIDRVLEAVKAETAEIAKAEQAGAEAPARRQVWKGDDIAELFTEKIRWQDTIRNASDPKGYVEKDISELLPGLQIRVVSGVYGNENGGTPTLCVSYVDNTTMALKAANIAHSSKVEKKQNSKNYTADMLTKALVQGDYLDGMSGETTEAQDSTVDLLTGYATLSSAIASSEDEVQRAISSDPRLQAELARHANKKGPHYNNIRARVEAKRLRDSSKSPLNRLDAVLVASGAVLLPDGEILDHTACPMRRAVHYGSRAFGDDLKDFYGANLSPALRKNLRRLALAEVNVTDPSFRYGWFLDEKEFSRVFAAELERASADTPEPDGRFVLALEDVFTQLRIAESNGQKSQSLRDRLAEVFMDHHGVHIKDCRSWGVPRSNGHRNSYRMIDHVSFEDLFTGSGTGSRVFDRTAVHCGASEKSGRIPLVTYSSDGKKSENKGRHIFLAGSQLGTPRTPSYNGSMWLQTARASFPYREVREATAGSFADGTEIKFDSYAPGTDAEIALDPQTIYILGCDNDGDECSIYLMSAYRDGQVSFFEGFDRLGFDDKLFVDEDNPYNVESIQSEASKKKLIAAAKGLNFKGGSLKDGEVPLLVDFDEDTAKRAGKPVGLQFTDQANRAIANTVARNLFDMSRYIEVPVEQDSDGNSLDVERNFAATKIIVNADGERVLNGSETGPTGANPFDDPDILAEVLVHGDRDLLSDPGATIGDLTSQEKVTMSALDASDARASIVNMALRLHIAYISGAFNTTLIVGDDGKEHFNPLAFMTSGKTITAKEWHDFMRHIDGLSNMTFDDLKERVCARLGLTSGMIEAMFADLLEGPDSRTPALPTTDAEFKEKFERYVKSARLADPTKGFAKTWTPEHKFSLKEDLSRGFMLRAASQDSDHREFNVAMREALYGKDVTDPVMKKANLCNRLGLDVTSDGDVIVAPWVKPGSAKQILANALVSVFNSSTAGLPGCSFSSVIDAALDSRSPVAAYLYWLMSAVSGSVQYAKSGDAAPLADIDAGELIYAVDRFFGFCHRMECLDTARRVADAVNFVQVNPGAPNATLRRDRATKGYARIKRQIETLTPRRARIIRRMRMATVVATSSKTAYGSTSAARGTIAHAVMDDRRRNESSDTPFESSVNGAVVIDLQQTGRDDLARNFASVDHEIDRIARSGYMIRDNTAAKSDAILQKRFLVQAIRHIPKTGFIHSTKDVFKMLKAIATAAASYNNMPAWNGVYAKDSAPDPIALRYGIESLFWCLYVESSTAAETVNNPFWTYFRADFDTSFVKKHKSSLQPYAQYERFGRSFRLHTIRPSNSVNQNSTYREAQKNLANVGALDRSPRTLRYMAYQNVKDQIPVFSPDGVRIPGLTEAQRSRATGLTLTKKSLELLGNPTAEFIPSDGVYSRMHTPQAILCAKAILAELSRQFGEDVEITPSSFISQIMPIYTLMMNKAAHSPSWDQYSGSVLNYIPGIPGSRSGTYFGMLSDADVASADAFEKLSRDARKNVRRSAVTLDPIEAYTQLNTDVILYTESIERTARRLKAAGRASSNSDAYKEIQASLQGTGGSFAVIVRENPSARELVDVFAHGGILEKLCELYDQIEGNPAPVVGSGAIGRTARGVITRQEVEKSAAAAEAAAAAMMQNENVPADDPIASYAQRELDRFSDNAGTHHSSMMRGSEAYREAYRSSKDMYSAFEKAVGAETIARYVSKWIAAGVPAEIARDRRFQFAHIARDYNVMAGVREHFNTAEAAGAAATLTDSNKYGVRKPVVPYVNSGTGNLESLFKHHDVVVVFDTETTGLKRTDEIVQLAAIRLERGPDGKPRETGRMSEYVKLTNREAIPAAATDVHHITDKLLDTKGVALDVALQKFDALMSPADGGSEKPPLLVAHNCRFDSSRLSYAYRLARGNDDSTLSRVDWLDTLTVFRDRVGFNFNPKWPERDQGAGSHNYLGHTLGALVAHYDKTRTSVLVEHEAGADVDDLYTGLIGLDLERPDLHKYVNVFGYPPGFGISEDESPSLDDVDTSPRVPSLFYAPAGVVLAPQFNNTAALEGTTVEQRRSGEIGMVAPEGTLVARLAGEQLDAPDPMTLEASVIGQPSEPAPDSANAMAQSFGAKLAETLNLFTDSGADVRVDGSTITVTRRMKGTRGIGDANTVIRIDVGSWPSATDSDGNRLYLDLNSEDTARSVLNEMTRNGFPDFADMDVREFLALKYEVRRALVERFFPGALTGQGPAGRAQGTPSWTVDSRGVRTLCSVIRLNQARANERSMYHEYFHAAFGMLRALGVMSDKDLADLAKRYPSRNRKAANLVDRADEEALADEFSAYVGKRNSENRRVAAAARRNTIFGKIFDFLNRLLSVMSPVTPFSYADSEVDVGGVKVASQDIIFNMILSGVMVQSDSSEKVSARLRNAHRVMNEDGLVAAAMSRFDGNHSFRGDTVPVDAPFAEGEERLLESIENDSDEVLLETLAGDMKRVAASRLSADQADPLELGGELLAGALMKELMTPEEYEAAVSEIDAKYPLTEEEQAELAADAEVQRRRREILKTEPVEPQEPPVDERSLQYKKYLKSYEQYVKDLEAYKRRLKEFDEKNPLKASAKARKTSGMRLEALYEAGFPEDLRDTEENAARHGGKDKLQKAREAFSAAYLRFAHENDDLAIDPRQHNYDDQLTYGTRGRGKMADRNDFALSEMYYNAMRAAYPLTSGQKVARDVSKALKDKIPESASAVYGLSEEEVAQHNRMSSILVSLIANGMDGVDKDIIAMLETSGSRLGKSAEDAMVLQVINEAIDNLVRMLGVERPSDERTSNLVFAAALEVYGNFQKYPWIGRGGQIFLRNGGRRRAINRAKYETSAQLTAGALVQAHLQYADIAQAAIDDLRKIYLDAKAHASVDENGELVVDNGPGRVMMAVSHFIAQLTRMANKEGYHERAIAEVEAGTQPGEWSSDVGTREAPAPSDPTYDKSGNYGMIERRNRDMYPFSEQGFRDAYRITLRAMYVMKASKAFYQAAGIVPEGLNGNPVGSDAEARRLFRDRNVDAAAEQASKFSDLNGLTSEEWAARGEPTMPVSPIETATSLGLSVADLIEGETRDNPYGEVSVMMADPHAWLMASLRPRFRGKDFRQISRDEHNGAAAIMVRLRDRINRLAFLVGENAPEGTDLLVLKTKTGHLEFVNGQQVWNEAGHEVHGFENRKIHAGAIGRMRDVTTSVRFTKIDKRMVDFALKACAEMYSGENMLTTSVGDLRFSQTDLVKDGKAVEFTEDFFSIENVRKRMEDGRMVPVIDVSLSRLVDQLPENVLFKADDGKGMDFYGQFSRKLASVLSETAQEYAAYMRVKEAIGPNARRKLSLSDLSFVQRHHLNTNAYFDVNSVVLDRLEEAGFVRTMREVKDRTQLRQAFGGKKRESVAVMGSIVIPVTDSASRLTGQFKSIESLWEGSTAYAKLLQAGRTEDLIGLKALGREIMESYREGMEYVRNNRWITDSEARFFNSLGSMLPFFAGSGFFAYRASRCGKDRAREEGEKLSRYEESFVEALNSDSPASNAQLRMIEDWFGTSESGNDLRKAIRDGKYRDGQPASVRTGLVITPEDLTSGTRIAGIIYAKACLTAYQKTDEAIRLVERAGGRSAVANIIDMYEQKAASEGITGGCGLTSGQMYRQHGVLPANMQIGHRVEAALDGIMKSLQFRNTLAGFLTSSDENGKPLAYMKPVVGTGQANVLPDQMWEELARWWAEENGLQYDEMKSARENASILYDRIIKGSAGNVNGRHFGTLAPEYMQGCNTIAEFAAVDDTNSSDHSSVRNTLSGGEALGYAKQLFSIPRVMGGRAKCLLLTHVMSWSKTLAVQQSLFFPIATRVESTTAAVGFLTMLCNGKYGAKAARKFSSALAAFDKIIGKLPMVDESGTGISKILNRNFASLSDILEMMDTDDPYLADVKHIASILGLSMSSQLVSPAEGDKSYVQQDVNRVVSAIESLTGSEKAADSMRGFLNGLVFRGSERAFTYVLNAVKLATAMQIAQKVSYEARRSGRAFNIYRDLRPYADYINAEIGGIDPLRYAWATPKFRKVMQNSMFSWEWTKGAWAAGGGEVFEDAIFGGHLTNPKFRQQLLGRWVRMYGTIMIGVPMMGQVICKALGKLMGYDDDSDEWLTLGNEEKIGMSAFNITPLLRGLANYPAWMGLKDIPIIGHLIPGYTGKDEFNTSGNRKYYMHFGKQGWEFLRWFSNPVDQALSKLSMPTQRLVEGVLGYNPASHEYELPFSEMGFFERWVNLTTDGATWNLAKSFMPFSWNAMSSYGDSGALPILGPVKMGTSRTLVNKELKDALTAWANNDRTGFGGGYTGGRFAKHPKTSNYHRVSEILRGARMNGVDPAEALKEASGQVATIMYRKMFKELSNAIDGNADETALRRAARSLHRLGILQKNAWKAMKDASKRHGIDLDKNPERLFMMKETFKQSFRNPYTFGGYLRRSDTNGPMVY